MAYYYIEEIKNRASQIIGYSSIKKTRYKKDLPKHSTLIDLNNIEFEEYIANTKNFYISGNKLMKIERK